MDGKARNICLSFVRDLAIIMLRFLLAKSISLRAAVVTNIFTVAPGHDVVQIDPTYNHKDFVANGQQTLRSQTIAVISSAMLLVLCTAILASLLRLKK